MSFSPAGVVAVPHFWSISSHDVAHVERAGGISVPTTGTAWVAGLAVYVPFVLDMPGILYEWWWMNATLTTSHNIDVGIYNMDFTKIQSLGSTVGGTTASSLIDTSTWTDLYVAPGSYYMAYVDDSTRNIFTSADARGLYEASGVMEQTGLSSTLPNPMVPIVYTRAFLPHFGMNFRSTAL